MDRSPGAVVPMANWGEGYNVNLIGLVHLEDGNVTKYDLNMHDHCVKRFYNKIEDNVDTISQKEKFLLGSFATSKNRNGSKATKK